MIPTKSWNFLPIHPFMLRVRLVCIAPAWTSPHGTAICATRAIRIKGIYIFQFWKCDSGPEEPELRRMRNFVGLCKDKFYITVKKGAPIHAGWERNNLFCHVSCTRSLVGYAIQLLHLGYGKRTNKHQISKPFVSNDGQYLRRFFVVAVLLTTELSSSRHHVVIIYSISLSVPL